MYVRENVSLVPLTTFRVGGPARFFVRAGAADDIVEAFGFARERGVPFFVLGSGTNVLAADEGFPGLIIKIESGSLDVSDDGLIAVDAGVPMGRLVQEAARASLAGLEWATGLPGTVGGAVFGNVGAFGHETGEFVKEVVTVDQGRVVSDVIARSPSTMLGVNSATKQSEAEPRPEHIHFVQCKLREGSHAISTRSPRALPSRPSGLLRFARNDNKEAISPAFRYRWSSFKEMPGAVIVSAVFQLRTGDPDAIRAAMQDAMTARREHQPLVDQSAGCIFKNPSPDVSAGKLIDECGLKGMRVGGAEVSPKHANFIVNTGTATAKDITELIELAKGEVRTKTGVVLEEEIRYLNAKLEV